MLFLQFVALVPLLASQGSAGALEDVPLEQLPPADDECRASDGGRQACALNALQRRGQKILGDTLEQPDDSQEDGNEDEGEEVEDYSLAEEGEEVSDEGGRRRRRRRRHAVPMKPVVMGISYGPMPCKDGNCPALMDDFMCEAAKPLWGPRGRADLQTISLLGANTVRLYGNSPTEDHSSFMDEAHRQKLKVVVGLSDYAYTQMQGNCAHNQYDCYSLVKAVYRMNLLKGFVKDEAEIAQKKYHPALSTVIVINEPDLKMPGIFEPRRFVKAIISALDGMLDAEKEVGVTGNWVNFTATFSFGICSNCKAFTNKPGLGQMSELEDAFLHPEAYGYKPKNNLTKVYYTRWTMSFNTAAPAKYVQSDFLTTYEEAFTATPVVIMEYHTPYWNAYEDLSAIFAVSRNSSMLLGASFFEFQVRYDKGGSETEFGMFGLGGYNLGNFDYYGDTFGDWCLKPVMDQFGSMPKLVAKAMGGQGPDWDMLCVPDPAKVTVDAAGYAQIASQDPARVAIFLGRIVSHLGGVVKDSAGLTQYAADIAEQYTADRARQFGEIVGALASPMGFASSWVSYDVHAKCLADRDADAASVGAAIGWACEKATTFNCTDMPLTCKGSVWATADWVFMKWYGEFGKDPLQNCYFGGAAILAASNNNWRRCGMECCSYTGESPLPPTVPPTLPPNFDPEGNKPTPSPALTGDCHFKEMPTISFFWDTKCLPHGGPGCNADGRHMECRFCGTGPFPACPTGPAFVEAVVAAPSPAP